MKRVCKHIGNFLFFGSKITADRACAVFSALGIWHSRITTVEVMVNFDETIPIALEPWFDIVQKELKTKEAE